MLSLDSAVLSGKRLLMPNSTLLRSSLLFTLALLAPTAPLTAQVASAEISGVVQDTSGAIVPNASVTATALATNTTRTATTGREGEYVLTQLKPRRLHGHR